MFLMAMQIVECVYDSALLILLENFSRKLGQGTVCVDS